MTTYIARYMHRRGQEPDYYRTVDGDTLNDATRAAERYTRKNFIMVGVTSND